jgi:hypothetical protein
LFALLTILFTFFVFWVGAIDPYVKPFFPPDPPQMTALHEFFVVLFARVSRLYEFLSYCLRVFHVLITFSRYDFSFDHVFRVHLTF